MHVAYKKEDHALPAKKPLSKKEMISRWAVVLERKWRVRDRAEALRKFRGRIEKLGANALSIYSKP